MCKITDILIDKTSHKTNLRVFSFSELKRERDMLFPVTSYKNIQLFGRLLQPPYKTTNLVRCIIGHSCGSCFIILVSS